MTDQLLTGAIKTVLRYAPIAVREPENYEARGELMWLSSLACNGILSTGSAYGGWSCHAIEHELSAFYDVTHGIGLAIVTPRWMRYVLNENTMARFVQYGTEVWGINASLAHMEIAEQAIAKTESFFRELGDPMTLTELGIGSEHFAEMAEHAVSANFRQYAYIPRNAEDVKHILEMCL